MQKELAIEFDYNEFENFKSTVCHQLVMYGDKKFYRHIAESNQIEKYWENDRQLYALYLVALLDYLSHKHHAPIYKKYNVYRKYKMNRPVFPLSQIAWSVFAKEELIIPSDCIPEFLQFNIIEGDVYDVK